MKYIGINRDVSPKDMPEGFGVDARNGINSKYLGANVNEGGFKPHQETNTTDAEKYGLHVSIGGELFTRSPIGEVTVDLDSTIICNIGYKEALTSDAVLPPAFSEIGIINSVGNYTVIINDKLFSTANKLGFTADKPITGEFSRNYLNELILVITDGERPPYYINVTTFLNEGTSTFNIGKIKMFPDFTQVNTITTISDTGGSLPSGAIYLSYKYISEDLSVTNGTLLDNPISIFNAPIGTTQAQLDAIEGDFLIVETSKSINVSIVNINTNFKKLEVQALVVQKGIKKAYLVKTVVITGSTTAFVVDSLADATEITISEILTPKLVFSKVYKFTQVYNRLYALKPTTNTLRNYQRYANIIQLSWSSILTQPSLLEPSSQHNFNHGDEINKGKTFLHKEVYAFYVHLAFTDGSVSEGFHIPYNDYSETVGEVNYNIGKFNDWRTASTLASAQGITAKKFQLEDTCELNGNKFGYWENADEYYPNTDDYDSFSLNGGQNLKGKKVRHHRFPSINWMKENTAYSTEAAYGITKLDRLSLNVFNVQIPTELQPFVTHAFISFAKRTYENSTVIGQSTVQFQSSTFYDNSGTNEKLPISWYSGLNTRWTYTGTANKRDDVIPYSPLWLNRDPSYNPTAIRTTKLRFYDLKLLTDTPDINPAYISNELFMGVRVKSFFTNSTGLDNDTGKVKARWFLDYCNKEELNIIGSANCFAVTTKEVGDAYWGWAAPYLDVRYRKILAYDYLNPSTIQTTSWNNEKVDNRCLEDTLLLTVDSEFSGALTSVVTAKKQIPINTDNQVFDWYKETDGAAWSSVIAQTYLTTLMSLPQNVYSSMFNQELVNTGVYLVVNANGTVNPKFSISKGDGFITVNSYHTGGWGQTRSNHIVDNTDTSALSRTLVNAIGESVINNQLRSSDTTDWNKRFYPKYPKEYIQDLLKESVATNKLYNSDYSVINNINSLVPYNAVNKYVAQDLHKINRSIAVQSERQDIGWKTWLTNDYYITVRNKGVIINGQGIDRELIISLERATLVTVGNEQLNVDAAQAFIGSGNIFERDAVEILPSKEGSIGTQHMFSCVATPMGYIFIDANRKQIVAINRVTPMLLSDKGLSLWFFNNLPITNKLFYTTSLYIEVPQDNTYFGFGYSIAYDNKFERLIITKKEYALTELAKAYLQLGAGAFNLRYLNNRWILNYLGVLSELTWDNTAYFTNTGWTVSFDLNSKAFTYFHDYWPDKIFNTRTKLFSFRRSAGATGYSNIGRMYIHNNDDKKGIYHNTTITDVDAGQTETAIPYNMYIVPVFGFKDKAAEIVKASWVSEVVNGNISMGSEVLYPQKTASKVLIFNSFQSTEENPLVIYSDNMDNFFTYNVRNIKGVWNFNNILDILALASYNSGTPFITNYSTLDTTQIDTAKAFYNKLPLIDQWVAVKIMYNNADNSKEFRILQVDISILPVNR